MTPDVPPGPSPASTEPSPAHHRVHVLNLKGEPGAQITLPAAFSAPVRTDLIARAVVSAQSARRQPHGTSPTAGVRHSVEWSGKGKGVARTPRLMGGMRGAQAPNTVGGRPAHPPRVATIWVKHMNVKERRLAFAAALAATRQAPLARARGHRFPESLHLPVVLEDPAESVATVVEAKGLLEKLHLLDDVTRAQRGVHFRAGRGKRRGRARKHPRSLLFVVSAPGNGRGFRNLSGVDVVPLGRLGTEDLAPGGVPGRLTLFTRASMSALALRLGGASP